MLKIHLARHFVAKDIAGVVVSNGFRHLHFPDAANQAALFRERIQEESFDFLGHSEAIRTRYSLELVTIGSPAGSKPKIQIPSIFLPDGADGELVLGSCKASLNPSTWSPEAQAALVRFGQKGAESIKSALTTAGVEDGTALIFTHGPMINSFAAALGGGNDQQLIDRLFKIDTKEGDQFVIAGTDVAHVPL